MIFYGIVFGAQCYLPRLRFSKSESSSIIIMDLDREIGRIGGRNTKAPIEFFDEIHETILSPWWSEKVQVGVYCTKGLDIQPM